LKQFSRARNQKLNAFLKNIEFVKADEDYYMYVAQVGDVKFFIVIYVNYLILVCNKKDKLLQMKDELFRKFKMKDFGICVYSLTWKCKGIMDNIFCTSTKLGISRRFSEKIAWRIIKLSKYHLIPRQS